MLFLWLKFLYSVGVVLGVCMVNAVPHSPRQTASSGCICLVCMFSMGTEGWLSGDSLTLSGRSIWNYFVFKSSYLMERSFPIPWACNMPQWLSLTAPSTLSTAALSWSFLPSTEVDTWMRWDGSFYSTWVWTSVPPSVRMQPGCPVSSRRQWCFLPRSIFNIGWGV